MNRIKEHIIELYSDTEDVMFADGLDDAIIGFEPQWWRVVYSRNKVVDIFISRDKMSPDEAIEFAEFNTFGAYLGKGTPIWVEDFLWDS
tara:strand:- start:25087 stop:25353 length:267 start_codon:yes stop_codon:yes gene_type:complete